MSLSVAIDGPAGAGKSTIARLVGEKFNLMYINTGSMYRAVAFFALKKGISPLDVEKLTVMIKELEMHFEGENLIVNGEDVSSALRTPIVAKNVSFFAAIPKVREILVSIQKEMSKKYDVIMDGRDIGTVVLKESPLKFYVTASPEVRAKRRFNEFKEKGIHEDYEKVLEDIIKRDYIDSNREVNPLKKAEDAIEIDTSNMDIEESVKTISFSIENYLKGNR